MPCERLQTQRSANIRPRPRPALTASVNGMAARWGQRVAWFPDGTMLPKIPSERAGGGCSATMPAAQLPIRYAVLAEWPVNQRLRACLGSRPALRGRVEYVQVSFVYVGEHHVNSRPAHHAHLLATHEPRRTTSALPDEVSTPALKWLVPMNNSQPVWVSGMAVRRSQRGGAVVSHAPSGLDQRHRGGSAAARPVAADQAA
jgi:hypothetical protein